MRPSNGRFRHILLKCLAARRRFVAYDIPLGFTPKPHRRKPMAKGIQSNKMVKKPKKDTSPPKPVSGSDRPVPPVTTVPLRGKLKNK